MRSISCGGDRQIGRTASSERGATVVEFLGVMVLIVFALMVLIQMAVWLWARNVAVTAADEGARAAAEVGRPLIDGEARTRSVLRDGLGGTAAAFRVDARQDGAAVVVRAEGTAPRIVPFLPGFDIAAEAHAFDEDEALPR
jgi:hypothetical protein